ncbi:hypothetical protein DQ04_11231000 [Trypanosoma grayi]|uniref:hypothetical protein n=1 Tax=Trypanosoma grayi TaxID=71804 RepID=UPI0004F407B4|nr:hypothetical protein DQ04_11231000 [Trypanosoma grayi]KEG07017.1 hypothetical protein DQ04_11231000 [Trypanosoma grayi]
MVLGFRTQQPSSPNSSSQSKRKEEPKLYVGPMKTRTHSVEAPTELLPPLPARVLSSERPAPAAPQHTPAEVEGLPGRRASTAAQDTEALLMNPSRSTASSTRAVSGTDNKALLLRLDSGKLFANDDDASWPKQWDCSPARSKTTPLPPSSKSPKASLQAQNMGDDSRGNESYRADQPLRRSNSFGSVGNKTLSLTDLAPHRSLHLVSAPAFFNEDAQGCATRATHPRPQQKSQKKAVVATSTTKNTATPPVSPPTSQQSLALMKSVQLLRMNAVAPPSANAAVKANASTPSSMDAKKTVKTSASSNRNGNESIESSTVVVSRKLSSTFSPSIDKSGQSTSLPETPMGAAKVAVEPKASTPSNGTRTVPSNSTNNSVAGVVPTDRLKGQVVIQARNGNTTNPAAAAAAASPVSPAPPTAPSAKNVGHRTSGVLSENAHTSATPSTKTIRTVPKPIVLNGTIVKTSSPSVCSPQNRSSSGGSGSPAGPPPAVTQRRDKHIVASTVAGENTGVVRVLSATLEAVDNSAKIDSSGKKQPQQLKSGRLSLDSSSTRLNNSVAHEASINEKTRFVPPQRVVVSENGQKNERTLPQPPAPPTVVVRPELSVSSLASGIKLVNGASTMGVSPSSADRSSKAVSPAWRSDQLTSVGSVITTDDDPEAIALAQYAQRVEVDLSMSTFRYIGAALSVSRTLRVLNLKGCTTDSEGLRGLSEIPTLHVVCVSHMRRLGSLQPLVQRRNGLMSNIREIDAQCTAVGDDGLVGIEKMTRLRRLDLSMTLVTDVNPLAKSHSLVELLLTATPVTTEGIRDLKMIPTLKAFNISRTKVRSLEEISKSQSLEELHLYSCNVGDVGLRGVEMMPSLKELDLSTTKVTDLSVLGASQSLQTLTAQWLALRNCRDIRAERRFKRSDEARLETCGEEDEEQAKLENLFGGGGGDGSSTDDDPEAGFRGLVNIPTLEHLDLSFSTIRSVRSLFASKSIKSLMLRRTHVDTEGIKGIHQMRSLQTLVITNASDPSAQESCEQDCQASTLSNGILTTITDLSRVLNLAFLDLSFTDVYDLRMLSALPNLRELYLVESLVTVEGMRGIEKLPSLHTLDISQTSVLSLQFLSTGCQVLRKLFVRSNRNVRGFRIANLHVLPALEVLDVSDTIVEDIKMLFRPVCRLKQLIWRWGERRDVTGPVDALPCWVKTPTLEGIESMPQLEVLDISGSGVHTVSFLAASRSLRRLVLARCGSLEDKGVIGLEKIPTLEELDLSHASRIADVRSLAMSSRLRKLWLGWTRLTLMGLGGILSMPTLKVLDLTSTSAENSVALEESMSDAVVVAGGVPLSRRLTESSIASEPVTVYSGSTPPQFQKRRHRRVSFVS